MRHQGPHCYIRYCLLLIRGVMPLHRLVKLLTYETDFMYVLLKNIPGSCPTCSSGTWVLQLEVSPVCWQVHVGLCPPRTNPLFYYKVTESYISAGTWGGQLGITCLPVNSCIQCSNMNLTNVRERSWVGGELAGYVNRNVISTSAQLNVGARHCNNIITTDYKLKPD